MTVMCRYTWYTGDTCSIQSPLTTLFDKDRVGEVSEVSEVSHTFTVAAALICAVVPRMRSARTGKNAYLMAAFPDIRCFAHAKDLKPAL
jgi:hypothetical protein